jgi:hypothetical protein
MSPSLRVVTSKSPPCGTLSSVRMASAMSFGRMACYRSGGRRAGACARSHATIPAGQRVTRSAGHRASSASGRRLTSSISPPPRWASVYRDGLGFPTR